ncbi:hypothetical protein BC833DRAFT_616665 [Globomyces pollinis-pini]|nr:hypothetical protein BC833DRAFT_616665 [Globomyces pollinis-pini]
MSELRNGTENMIESNIFSIGNNSLVALTPNAVNTTALSNNAEKTKDGEKVAIIFLAILFSLCVVIFIIIQYISYRNRMFNSNPPRRKQKKKSKKKSSNNNGEVNGGGDDLEIESSPIEISLDGFYDMENVLKFNSYNNSSTSNGDFLQLNSGVSPSTRIPTTIASSTDNNPPAQLSSYLLDSPGLASSSTVNNANLSSTSIVSVLATINPIPTEMVIQEASGSCAIIDRPTTPPILNTLHTTNKDLTPTSPSCSRFDHHDRESLGLVDSISEYDKSCDGVLENLTVADSPLIP